MSAGLRRARAEAHTSLMKSISATSGQTNSRAPSCTMMPSNCEPQARPMAGTPVARFLACFAG
eukprot:11052352-Alexandrium_andersonii.AAC.1